MGSTHARSLGGLVVLAAVVGGGCAGIRSHDVLTEVHLRNYETEAKGDWRYGATASLDGEFVSVMVTRSRLCTTTTHRVFAQRSTTVRERTDGVVRLVEYVGGGLGVAAAGVLGATGSGVSDMYYPIMFSLLLPIAIIDDVRAMDDAPKTVSESDQTSDHVENCDIGPAADVTVSLTSSRCSASPDDCALASATAGTTGVARLSLDRIAERSLAEGWSAPKGNVEIPKFTIRVNGTATGDTTTLDESYLAWIKPAAEEAGEQAQRRREQDAQQALAEARKLLAANDFAGARGAARRCLGLDEQNADCQTVEKEAEKRLSATAKKAAVAALRKGDYSGARDALRECSGGGAVERIVTGMQTDEDPECAKIAGQIDDAQSAAYLAAAKAALGKKDFEAARSATESCLALRPDSAECGKMGAKIDAEEQALARSKVVTIGRVHPRWDDDGNPWVSFDATAQVKIREGWIVGKGRCKASGVVRRDDGQELLKDLAEGDTVEVEMPFPKITAPGGADWCEFSFVYRANIFEDGGKHLKTVCWSEGVADGGCGR